MKRWNGIDRSLVVITGSGDVEVEPTWTGNLKQREEMFKDIEKQTLDRKREHATLDTTDSHALRTDKLE